MSEARSVKPSELSLALPSVLVSRSLRLRSSWPCHKRWSSRRKLQRAPVEACAIRAKSGRECGPLRISSENTELSDASGGKKDEMSSLRRLVAGLFLFGAICAASPALTRVRDVLYRADGMPLTGVVVISWPAFTAADGTTIAANTMNVEVSNGTFRADLVATTNAQPSVTYSVRMVSDGKDQTLETWSVPPSAGPLTIASVLAGSSTPRGTVTAPLAADKGTIQISDVVGLDGQLAERPVMGSGYASGRAAVIDGTGAIAAAAGTTSDCVRVDGSSGPCGGSGSTSGASFIDAEVPSGVVDGAK